MDEPNASRSSRLPRIELTWGALGRTFLAIGGVWLLIQLWQIIVLILFSLILVGTLNPVIGALMRKGLGRITALVVVGLALLGVTALLGIVTLPPLLQQVVELVVDAPAQRDALATWLEGRQLTVPLAKTVRNARVDQSLDWLTEYVMAYSSSIIVAVGYLFTAVVLAFYLLADPTRSMGVLYICVPRRHHVRLARIMLRLETIVGGYVRGQLLTSTAIGIFVFILLTILGIDNALALAVFAALVDVIPFIGSLIASVPAVIASLKHGMPTVLTVVAALAVYQEIESRLIVPKVYGRVLRLSAASVIIALLVGGTLLGIIGALLALPITAALLMMLHELRVDLPGDGIDRTTQQASDADTELRYERLSAGLPASEAAEVATAVAREVATQDVEEEALRAASDVATPDEPTARAGS